MSYGRYEHLRRRTRIAPDERNQRRRLTPYVWAVSSFSSASYDLLYNEIKAAGDDTRRPSHLTVDDTPF